MWRLEGCGQYLSRAPRQESFGGSENLGSQRKYDEHPRKLGTYSDTRVVGWREGGLSTTVQCQVDPSADRVEEQWNKMTVCECRDKREVGYCQNRQGQGQAHGRCQGWQRHAAKGKDQ